MENNKQKEERLYYNIQAIEICKKHGVEYKYSTSNDLIKDYLKVEDVPEAIGELKALNCWTKVKQVSEEKELTDEDGKPTGEKVTKLYIKFETDVKHL